MKTVTESGYPRAAGIKIQTNTVSSLCFKTHRSALPVFFLIFFLSVQITKPGLTSGLRLKWDLTTEEWSHFAVGDLSSEIYVKVDTTHFQPIPPQANLKLIVFLRLKRLD